MTGEELEVRLRADGKADEILPLIDKLGFKLEFVAAHVLSRAGPLSVSETAMLWQGMPNKHDRKRTQQLFDALTQAGLLTADENAETWRATVN